MKKTKLLMPILGISAIATAIVPTISSCNDPKEETKGEKVDVKIDAEIDSTHIASKDDKPEITSKNKEAYTNEDYVLDITWNEYAPGTGEKVFHTIASQVVIKDADGKVVCTEKDGDYISYTQTQYGSIKLTIKKEKIFEGMQIIVSVRRSDALVNYTNFSLTNDLIDKSSKTKDVMGLASQPIDIKGTEKIFCYQISLSDFNSQVREKGGDIASDNELVVYVRNSDKSARIYPAYPSDIYLNNKMIQHKWVEGDEAYEIHIFLPDKKTVNDLLLESTDQIITGYFDITGESSLVAQGSQLCVYTPGLIQK